MKNEEIAQWVIDNRYPKSEKERVSDLEMYDFIISQLEKESEECKDEIIKAFRAGRNAGAIFKKGRDSEGLAEQYLRDLSINLKN